MHIDLTGQVALVTGAAGGMGRAIAGVLHQAGARLALTDLDHHAVTPLAAALDPPALALPGDIAVAADVANLTAAIMARFGRIDIVVNNAGVLFPTRLESIDEPEWRRTIDVNLTGVFLCTQATARPMIAQRYGRIVNVSSSAGRSVSTLGGAHYTASKAGVLGLTRAAARELAPHGVTVNAICPGLIDTEMARAGAFPERLLAYAASFPARRLGTAREVADAVCFLASPQAGYITGASLDINGGDLML